MNRKSQRVIVYRYQNFITNMMQTHMNGFLYFDIDKFFIVENCPKDDKFRYFIPMLRKLGAA